MWAGSDFAELNAKFWFKIGVPAFKTIQKIAQCEIRILLCIVCSVRVSLRNNSAPVYRSILLYRSRQVCEIFTQHSTSSVSIYSGPWNKNINNYKRKLGPGSRCPLHLCVQWHSISSVENLCWFLPLRALIFQSSLGRGGNNIKFLSKYLDLSALSHFFPHLQEIDSTLLNSNN